MATEGATTIVGLDPTNPAGSALKSEGDDHLRMIKTVLKNAFPALGGALNRHSTKVAATTVADDANGTVYRTTGTWALTGPDNGAAMVANGFTIQVDNSAGAGTITFTPQHAQTVNGAATLAVTAGRRYRFRSNGTTWVAEEYGVYASVAAQLPKGIFAGTLVDVPPYLTVQKIACTGEVVDVDSAFVPASSRYTAPATGIYIFFVSIAAQSSDVNREFDFAIYLHKNGVQATNNYAGTIPAVAGQVSYGSMTVMLPLSLAAGDYVEPFVQATTPGVTGGGYWLQVGGTFMGFPVA